MTFLYMSPFLVGSPRENWPVLHIMSTQSQCDCNMCEILLYGSSILVGPRTSMKKEKWFLFNGHEDHHTSPIKLLGDFILKHRGNIRDVQFGKLAKKMEAHLQLSWTNKHVLPIALLIRPRIKT